MSDTVDHDALAAAVAEGMYPRDKAAQAMGIEIIEAKAGTATAKMTVRDDMLNFHGTCHGGMMFAFAGSILAYVINGDNRAAVAQGCSITYTRPAHLNDQLTAICKVVNQAGRSGVYDVEVTNQNSEIVALFRGQSSKIKGEAVPGLNKQFGIYGTTN
ncbi:MAG: hydroxyphenylacetyl-CoA thioesterase PaaI [Magnetovibrio sp.]|nr:hydroxyphenylacetyl-CoA thioesterase PaaI [Magnetovibrio sp.]